MDTFNFSKSVSFSDLNNSGMRIGPEFMNNLLITGRDFFTNSMPDIKVRIITGILPLLAIKKEDTHQKKFCKGLAVEFYYDELEPWVGNKLHEYIFKKYKGIHIIMDYENKTVYLGRKFKSNKLFHKQNGVLLPIR